MEHKTKQELFDKISEQGFFDYLVQNDLFLVFINQFKDLKSIPSTDGRPQFKNAEDDIRKHFIMNDDISLNEIFSNIVGLYEDDELFQNFLLAVVDSKFSEEKVTTLLADLINRYLHLENQELYLYGYGSNKRPIYKIKKVEEEYSPRGVEQNKIPFFVDKLPSGNPDYSTNHNKPTEFPCFVLAFYKWNDFGVHSRFNLFHYDKKQICTRIGNVKIIHTSYNDKESGEYQVVDYMGSRFEQLTTDFCSLGQDANYYHTLKRLFGKQMKSILWALRDCAIYPRIEEKFSNHPYFFSLIREQNAENALNDIIYQLNGDDTHSRFCFKYNFQPKYANQPTSISFNYSSEGMFPNNLYAIIGRNGTGKTQLISQLPRDLESDQNACFDHKPSFKKYITVSYSYYDKFEIPDASASFDYHYCGLLKKLPNGKKEVMSREELQSRLIGDCEEINKKGRVNEWEEVMNTFFPPEIISSWRSDSDNNYLSSERIANDVEHMSSGEASFIYVFFDIMAHIRKYSFILFDEPETHLHPTAITSLINAIQRLLKSYTSYGLIVTHSPIIVRELLSRNVLVMRRQGNYLSVHKIGIESFGENLSILTNEIFDDEVVIPYYKSYITQLVNEGFGYDEIVQNINTEDIPLGLNLMMYVKNLTIVTQNEKD